MLKKNEGCILKLEIIEQKIEKVRDLKEFFQSYIEKARGVLFGEDRSAQYITELLAGLNDMDVKALKNQAFIVGLIETDRTLPLESRVEIARQIGDGVLGVFGFFPEVVEYRHEYRDAEAFTLVGSRAYGLASAYAKGYQREIFREFAHSFPKYLDLVREVRAKIDYEKSIDYHTKKAEYPNFRLGL